MNRRGDDIQYFLITSGNILTQHTAETNGSIQSYSDKH